MLHENPGRPGLVRQVVSVLIGHSEAIDMDRVQIEWNREADHENISRTMIATRVCPELDGLQYTQPASGCTADSDDWLEPGE
ncbi:MAG: hypothetical protein WCB46_00620 [Methanoregula sp.]